MSRPQRYERVSDHYPRMPRLASPPPRAAGDNLRNKERRANDQRTDVLISQINTADESDHIQGQNTYSTDDQHIPNSPPPSFRSRNSSPTSHRFLHHEDPLAPDNALHDAFDSPSDDEHDDFEDASEDVRDRRRLIPETPGTRGDTATEEQDRAVERRPVSLPAFQPTTGRVYGAGNGNDGVFANLSAKPARGEQEDEKPPVSYTLLSSCYNACC